MNENLWFGIPTHSYGDSYFPIPANENYHYWVHLMKHFLAQSDTIEIHCWNAETDTIGEMISSLNEFFLVTKEGELTIFKGNKTSSVTDYLLNNIENKDGELKWFSVFLKRNTGTFLSSEHWGTEFFAPNINEKDIAFIKSVMPPETNFHQYQ